VSATEDVQRVNRSQLGKHASYPWLVADIGGTNARFGLVRGDGAAVGDVITLRCADFASPDAAANAYLDQVASEQGSRPRPQLGAFALATPIDGDTIRMTNSEWVISIPRAEHTLGLRRLLVLNDFEALALSLPHLRRDEMSILGSGAPDPGLPMAVIGPGTGLGVAACIPAGRSWRALAGEGGHATACAADDFESDVLRIARRRFEHVSAERLLSGIGLPVLLVAIAEIRAERIVELTAAEITHRALTEHDPLCTATLDTFCAMLGSFAGNVALTLGARGGVFVAGGIAPRLGDFFVQSRFRARFEAKGRFRRYLEPVATALILAPHPALLGAARSIELMLDGDGD
jgi:glucokinase